MERSGREMTMTTNHAPEVGLDELEPETVEDLDVAEDADGVAGGPAVTTGGCYRTR